MRAVRYSALIGTLFSLIVAPFSYGAAQLNAGAKTSAQPTAAVGTALRSLQITFDPDVTPDATTVTPPSYNVTSFQLSVKYDATKLDVSASDIQFVGPYSQSPPPISIGTDGVTPLSGPATSAIIDPVTGLISFISGTAPVGSTQPGDVNIFLINFHLKTTTSSFDPLTFTIFADTHNGINPDFIQGTDPNNPDPLTNTATSVGNAVASTTITNSFAGFSAQVNGTAVPLPAGTVPCGAMLASLAIFQFRRRRRAA